MASKFTSAQHFVECDQCEVKPATFICKTCPGQLCEECKTEHEKKKLTKNHEITEYTSQNIEFYDLLYCFDHKTKCLEYFCKYCEKPICTECILESHNGHAIQKLSEVHKEIKEDLQRKKKEIQKYLLPKYRELLEKENENGTALTKQADEIKIQIKAHTDNLVKVVKQMGRTALQELKLKKKEGLCKIDDSKAKLQKSIDKLQLADDRLTENIEAKPGIAFFQPVEKSHLEEFQRSPVLVDYKLSDFQPENIDKIINQSFGKLPSLEKVSKYALSFKILINNTFINNVSNFFRQNLIRIEVFNFKFR